MKRECGVVLADEQQYLLDSRLGPVARQHGHASLTELVETVCSSLPSAPVACSVVDALTTHESLFFRDQAFWRQLEEHILPQLIAEADGRPLRFWSAACSHGQEPYSLAMLLEEKWPHVAATAQILASDVSPLAVQRGREGLYSMLEVNRGLVATRLLRHFTQESGSFRIQSLLRNRISWFAYNLLGTDVGPSRCDVVLCRNVLIYFSDRDRAFTLERMESASRPGGYIALGGTETTPRPSLAPGWYQLPTTPIRGFP